MNTVEFKRKISTSEVKTTYLNLTGIDGKAYGSLGFPPHKTTMVLIDQNGREFQVKKHGGNQIWGNIRKWYEKNNINAGDVVNIKFDPEEKKNNLAVLHVSIVTKQESSLSVAITEGEEPGNDGGGRDVTEIPMEFEKQLEDFIEMNLDLVEKGLRLYTDEMGNKGRQYPTDVGLIDLLCVNKSNNFVIMELKKQKTSDHVVGQVSRYVGWIKRNLAKMDQRIQGIIVTHEFDEKLDYAVAANDNLKILYYRVKLEFIKENEIKKMLK